MAYASRQTSYLLGSVGATLQVLAGWWDVYSHLLFGSVDPWWNPAHLTLYFGVAIVIIAVWRGLRFRSPQPALSVSPVNFANAGGLKLAALGSGMQIVAGVWNEIVHHLFPPEPKIAPAHALLTLGMLTISLGMIVGLAIEYGMITHRILVVSSMRRWMVVVCMLLVFASIWLASAGALIYLARSYRGSPSVWIVAALLSLVSMVVLVPVKQVLHRIGSATIVAVIFHGVTYFFLVAYVGAPAYVPWGIASVAIYDALVAVTNRKMKRTLSLAVSSIVPGVLFYWTYFPFTLYLFPWSIQPQVFSLMILFASVLGALVGLRIFSGISTLALGGVQGQVKR